MSAIVNLFYIYDPWLFHFARMALIIGLISAGILLYKIYKREIREISLPLDSLLVLLGLIGLSFIPMLTYGTQDFSVVLMYSKALILFGLGIIIYQLFYLNNQNKLIDDLKIGISLQAIIGFLGLVGIPFIIDMALSTNVVLTKFYGSEQEYRLYNITSSAFFQLSLFYTFLFHFLLAYNHKNNTIHSVFIFLMLFIGLISGRSFLIISFISLAIYFKWRYLSYLALFAAICIGLAIFIPEHKYVAHALEPLINLIYGKGTISSSTDTLVQKHLFIPELKQILIGDGYYHAKEGGYYGRTDSGFLRQLLYGGIGYLLLCFSVTAYFVIRVAKNWFNSNWKFILSTLAIFSILNVKADTYAFPGIMMILLMFLSLFGNSGKQYIIQFSNKEK